LLSSSAKFKVSLQKREKDFDQFKAVSVELELELEPSSRKELGAFETAAEIIDARNRKQEINLYYPSLGASLTRLEIIHDRQCAHVALPFIGQDVSMRATCA